jgi:hypothetical protein
MREPPRHDFWAARKKILSPHPLENKGLLAATKTNGVTLQTTRNGSRPKEKTIPARHIAVWASCLARPRAESRAFAEAHWNPPWYRARSTRKGVYHANEGRGALCRSWRCGYICIARDYWSARIHRLRDCRFFVRALRAVGVCEAGAALARAIGGERVKPIDDRAIAPALLDQASQRIAASAAALRAPRRATESSLPTRSPKVVPVARGIGPMSAPG